MRNIGTVSPALPCFTRRLAALLVSSLVLAACSSSVSGSSGVSGSQKLSGNELKYGASPEQNSSITYQPDVVFVGGANSIKSVSADGLVWTISGSAPNVNELKAGMILFASSRGVGRVLAVSQHGADKQVVLGPVNITDVIRDGNFASAAPIPLGTFQAYSAPSQPGLLTETEDSGIPASTGSPGGSAGTFNLPPVHLVAVESGEHGQTTSPDVVLTSAPYAFPPGQLMSSGSVGNYQLDPFCCSNGLGVQVTYDNNGLRVRAKVTLHFHKPSVSYKLGIAGGKVNAAIELHGAAGFSIGFEATSATGLDGNVANQRVQIPVEFSFPVIGTPFTIDFDQVFGMDTAFTAKNSVFAATGDYTLGGTLGFGVVNGQPTVYTPHSLTPTKTLTSTMTLLSVGPASLIVAYAAKFGVGIGAFGFRTGPWYELTIATGVTDTGPTSEFQCRKVAFAISSEYGIGYRMPKPVAAAINAVLSVFNASPIQAAGGLVGPSITAIKKSSTFPPIAACA